MKRTYRMLLLVIMSQVAFAQVSDRDGIIKALQKLPKCDEEALKVAPNNLKLDVELIVEGAKAGCLNALLAPYRPNPSAPIDEIVAWRKMIGESEKSYLNYVDEFILKSKAMMKESGSSPWTDSQAYALGNSTGYFEASSKAICADTKVPNSKTTDLCTQLPRVLKVISQLEELGKQDELNNKKAFVDSFASHACPVYWDQRSAEKELAHEKKIMQVSGVGNAARMHEIGQDIVMSTEKLENLQREYKAKEGKAYDLKVCPGKYNRWAGTAMSGE